MRGQGLPCTAGQGTIEYLVIIAVVVVLSLIVVGLILGGNFNSVDDTTAKQSKMFWLSQTVGVGDALIDSEGDGKLNIKSLSADLVELVSVDIGGVSKSLSNKVLSLGQSETFWFGSLPSCDSQRKSFEVVIHYRTNGLDKSVTGQPLVVDCGAVASLIESAGVSLLSPANSSEVLVTDVNFIFNVSGSDVNYCTLWLNGGTDQNISGNLSGEYGFYKTNLAGNWSNYNWNVNCCNVYGTCVQSDLNYSFVIPNRAPVVRYSSPHSGTYSGSLVIDFNVYDPDGVVDSLDANIYYSTLRGTNETKINDVNLLSTCFSDGNYLRERTCSYEWLIDSSAVSGDYYIDVNVSDGNKSGMDSSTNTIHIDACTVPYNGILLSADTNFCYGNYSLAGGATGAIQFNASGVAGNPLTLDCHDAIISGSGAYGIYVNNKNYIEIKNCGVFDYGSASLYLYSSHSSVSDNNFSKTGVKAGAGIYTYQVTTALTDVNFLRNSIANRANAINVTGDNAARIQTYFNFLDNNLNDNTNALSYSGTSMNYFNLQRNQLKNNSGSAINITGNYHLISNNDFSDSATGVYLTGSHTLISDSNFTKTGARSGKGIDVYAPGLNLVDNNFLRNTIENRANAMHFYGDNVARSHSYYNILDNNLSNNTYAISYATTVDNYFNIRRNQLANSTQYSIYLLGDYTTITNDNNFQNSTNGIQLRSYNTLSNLNLGPQNIPGNAIYLTGSHNVVSDCNLTNPGAKAGSGVYVYAPGANLSDNNFLRNTIENRANAIYLYADSAARSHSYYSLVDNNFNNNNYGAFVYNCIGNNFDFRGNQFRGNTQYGISIANGSYFTVTNDNSFHNSVNGIQLGSYTNLSNLNLGDQNITGTVIYFTGSHNVVSDSNLSLVGTKAGNGIYVMANGIHLYDNNFYRNTIENRNNAIYMYGDNVARTHYNYNITDNNLNNSGYGVILYYVSGNSWNILRNQARNSSTAGISLLGSSANYFTIANNDASDSVTGMDLYGSHNLIQDCNFSKSGTKSGAGMTVYAYANISDNNFYRIEANNRANALALNGSTNMTHSNYNITDNNFNDSTYGISYSTTAASLLVIRRNQLKNSSQYGIYLAGDYLTISNDNNFQNSVNGITVRSYNTLSNLTLGDQNIAGNAIYLTGSHNVVSDCNLSNPGVKGGSGLYVYAASGSLTDNNFLRNSINNRANGIMLYGTGSNTHSGYQILDNNFRDNSYAIAYSTLTINALNIQRNRFVNSSTRSILLSGTGHTLKLNNFITNVAKPQGGTFSDVNANYYSDWNGASCNCGTTYCVNAYTFTTGTDNYPYCSQIS
jgi:hypothetical protein